MWTRRWRSRGGERVSVIGGAEIFALFLPLADRIELTEVLDDVRRRHGRLPIRERQVTGGKRSARSIPPRMAARPFRFVTLERA